MRTTLTLEPDVAAEIEKLRRQKGVALKDIVNEAMRRGLAEMARPQKRKPFKLKTFDCGAPLLHDVDNVAEVLDMLDSDDFK